MLLRLPEQRIFVEDDYNQLSAHLTDEDPSVVFFYPRADSSIDLIDIYAQLLDVLRLNRPEAATFNSLSALKSVPVGVNIVHHGIYQLYTRGNSILNCKYSINEVSVQDYVVRSALYFRNRLRSKSSLMINMNHALNKLKLDNAIDSYEFAINAVGEAIIVIEMNNFSWNLQFQVDYADLVDARYPVLTYELTVPYHLAKLYNYDLA